MKNNYYYYNPYIFQEGSYRTLTTQRMTRKKNLQWQFVVPVDNQLLLAAITGELSS